MTKVECKIWKCETNDNGFCTLSKIKISKLGCIDVQTY